MQTLHIDIMDNETQEQLSDRAQNKASELTNSGKVVIAIQTLPKYAEIQYFD